MTQPSRIFQQTRHSRSAHLQATAQSFYRSHHRTVPAEITALIKEHGRVRLSPTQLNSTLSRFAPDTDPLTLAQDLLARKFHSAATVRQHMTRLFGQARTDSHFRTYSSESTSPETTARRETLRSFYTPIFLGNPSLAALLAVLSEPATLNAKKFPIITQSAYQRFLRDVPHLFGDGQRVLEEFAWIESLLVAKETPAEIANPIRYAIAALRRVVLTASITSPSDLWLMRQILDTYQQFGILDEWTKGKAFLPSDISRRYKLDLALLEMDLAFLYSRGWLIRSGKTYQLNPDVLESAHSLTPLPPKMRTTKFVPLLTEWFETGSSADADFLREFMSLPTVLNASDGWIAQTRELEIALRVTPSVMALRKLGRNQLLTKNTAIRSVLPNLPDEVCELFKIAGYVDSELRVTDLGEYCFGKGPGPIGIIHAYRTDLIQHPERLRTGKRAVWVEREDNIGASQDANRKSFADINDALDQFCADTGFSYQTFIEHAVGQGEATRQRHKRSSDQDIQYVGADLENATIDRAEALQRAGDLPTNMKFVRNADIGNPEILLKVLRLQHIETHNAVMVVGNGFHEVRKQTDEKMVGVFDGYRKAGLILAFTEEIALTDDDLIATGYNTYNAGFRYVHQISGQGLRSAFHHPGAPVDRLSWAECAEKAGYVVLEKYTRRARTIYPHPRANGYNPSISVSYFCVPRALAIELGLISVP